MSTIASGFVYPASRFSSFSDTSHDFMIFEMKNGTPTLSFQPAGSAGLIKQAFVVNTSPSNWYVTPAGSDYLVLLPFHPAATLCAFITPDYQTWLQTNGTGLHIMNPAVKLARETGLPDEKQAFTHIYIARGLNVDPTIPVAINIMNYIDVDPRTFPFWSPPPADAGAYVASIKKYDIKLLNDVSWHTKEYIASVKTALGAEESSGIGDMLSSASNSIVGAWYNQSYIMQLFLLLVLILTIATGISAVRFKLTQSASI